MTIEQSREQIHGSGEVSGNIRPRAMIHKKILDYAREHPDASIEAIADEVSGTSPPFVERVFETYGDPANTDRPQSPDNASSQPPDEPEPTTEGDDPMSDTAGSSSALTSASASTDEQQTHTDGGPKVETIGDNGDRNVVTVDGESVQLSERQYETLRTVAADPSATQAEIADTLDVSRATISKRLKDVDRFEWGTRQSFVEQAFGNGEGSTQPVARESPDNSSAADSTSDDDLQAEMIAELAARVDALETQLDSKTTDSGGLEDPELLHKVIHATMDAEYISDDEELRLLRTLLPSDPTGG